MTLDVVIMARALYPWHPPGGMERAVYEQVRHLAALGIPLTVVTQFPTASSGPSSAHGLAASPLPPDVAAAHPELAGVQWRFRRYGDLPLRRNSVLDRLVNYPLFVRRVAAQAPRPSRHQRTIIHAHGLLVAAAPGGLPHVYAPHGLEEFSRASLRKWLAYTPIRLALRRGARRAAAVLATDTAMKPLVRSALGVRPEQIEVVPNGVSLEWLDGLRDEARQQELAERLALGAASLHLITCARLERNKGLHVALEALAACRGVLPADWRWWIVGTGQEEQSLRRQCIRLGLDAHVRLLGHLPDVDLHNLVPQMDLYLMPSLYEGSSIATLEAMAHRLPVLATAIGGLPDKVLPDRTGYLTQPDDAGALAETLRQALGERQRWPALGHAGRTLVAQQFAWPVIARQLLDLYGRLLQAPGD